MWRVAVLAVTARVPRLRRGGSPSRVQGPKLLTECNGPEGGQEVRAPLTGRSAVQSSGRKGRVAAGDSTKLSWPSGGLEPDQERKESAVRTAAEARGRLSPSLRCERVF